VFFVCADVVSVCCSVLQCVAVCCSVYCGVSHVFFVWADVVETDLGLHLIKRLR